MEKNQQSNIPGDGQQSNTPFTNNQPGQQPPAPDDQASNEEGGNTAQDERHSESSFPQSDEETLGTP